MSLQTGVPLEQSSRPVWQGFDGGVHDDPVVQAMHVPLLHTPAPPSAIAQEPPLLPGDHAIVLEVGWQLMHALLGSAAPLAYWTPPMQQWPAGHMLPSSPPELLPDESKVASVPELLPEPSPPELLELPLLEPDPLLDPDASAVESPPAASSPDVASGTAPIPSTELQPMPTPDQRIAVNSAGSALRI